MADITFTQAVQQFADNNEHNQIKYEELLEEVKDTYLEGLDATDINYYCAELNRLKPQNVKDYTPNQVRRMMQESENPFGILHSFENDEGDDIFDYF